jgi:hypothetical protein
MFVLPTSTANNIEPIVAENETLEQIKGRRSHNLVVHFYPNDVNCFQTLSIRKKSRSSNPKSRGSTRVKNRVFIPLHW